MKKIHGFLEKLAIPNWLAILLFVCLILRIPSFFEPYYYGDEMIYLTLGQGIRQGVPLYSGLHDNKPPVLYLIAALAGNLVWFKIFLAIAGIVSIIFFFKIAKNKLATIIFALFITLPLLEGNIANAENFMMVFSLGGIYLLFSRKHNLKNLIFAGFLFGISTLTKVPALFDFPIIFVFWFLTRPLKKESIKVTLKETIILSLGFILPVLLSFVWFYLKGSLPEYLKAAFLQNVGYVSSWRPGDVQKSFLVRNLPLLIRGFVVFLGLTAVFSFRKKLSAPFILAVVWFLFSLFAATLSERPYPHYLLQVAPPLCLLLGILITKTKERSFVFIPLLLFVLAVIYFRFWYYPTASYYLRSLKFTLKVTTKEQYFAQFGRFTLRNYQIADFLALSSRATDHVFVWGPDSPTIYALSRKLPPIKYTADYHVNDYANKKIVASELALKRPKFIILLPEAGGFAEILPLIRGRYYLINRIEGAEVWSLISSNK